MNLEHLLLIDIDGLRPDVFAAALQQGMLPNLAKLLGSCELGQEVIIPALSTAPSITFCAQASLFTGTHPKQHGITGNQFFDRFGSESSGNPRFFAFDVGDTLEFDDAVQVFTHNLASNQLQVPTLYERMAQRGKTAVVAGNMYGSGAAKWLKPDLPKLGRFVKGGRLFGMSPEAYDRHVLEKLIRYIEANALPDIITLYFMGLDFTSHKQGPAAQSQYLIDHIDPMVGELWAALRAKQPDVQKDTVVAIFSDHGQIEVIDDDRHSLKLGFPFDREMAQFFDALDLDVHDFPNEAPNCNAVLALNGGLADVYLHHHTGTWQSPPDFAKDVLPVGLAFWEAHQTGRYAIDMQGTLSAVLVRNVEQAGWQAPFAALTPAGKLLSLETWFAKQPAALFADPVNRLHNLSGRHSGDLLLLSNYADQYYFGKEHKGVHGGLHPDDSRATLAFGWPGLPADSWQATAAMIRGAIEERCLAEGERQPCITDLLTGVMAVADQFWV